MRQPIKIALVQLSSTEKLEENYKQIRNYLYESIAKGARLILTPEVSNFISNNEELRWSVLSVESEDPILRLVKKVAFENNVWILIGSLAIKINETIRNLYINRSFLIGPNGKVVARYDKIHMFDINLSNKISFKESKYFRPGSKAILVKTHFAKLGMTICYDLRFPNIFNRLANAGAKLIFVPSAFTVPTGKGHWEPLLRARAIENNVYILAPAQCGQNGKNRFTWGHSLVVDPDGKVVNDSGKEPGVAVVELEI